MCDYEHRCPETECGLGFSTKQCLQVHLRKAHGFSEDSMPQVQRSIPYTFDAYSGGVIKDPGRGKLPDFPPPTTPTRLHQQLDQTGQQVLFDSIDVIVPPFFFCSFYDLYLFRRCNKIFRICCFMVACAVSIAAGAAAERESPITYILYCHNELLLNLFLLAVYGLIAINRTVRIHLELHEPFIRFRRCRDEGGNPDGEKPIR